MQINVHNFTLTTTATATIQITASDDTIHNYPDAVFRALAAVEALDLTGYEWEVAAVAGKGGLTPEVTVYLNKI
jgi:hypothetical protein